MFFNYLSVNSDLVVFILALRSSSSSLPSFDIKESSSELSFESESLFDELLSELYIEVSVEVSLL